MSPVKKLFLFLVTPLGSIVRTVACMTMCPGLYVVMKNFYFF